MRLLNSVISNARGAGVDGDKWKAPVVLCMGPQSSGKSSLIWRLTGLPLPRDSQMCTKCPQEIRMNYAKDFSCEIRVRHEYDQFLQKKAEVDEERLFEPFYDIAEFGTKVKQASDTIVPGRNFSLSMLIIDVKGPDFPPLNVVDMPGKVQAGFKPRVVEINRKMYEEYMSREEVIMVVLHQAMNNFENNDVYAFARKYDPSGQRTIGILTKPDKVSNFGEEANAFEVLQNEPTCRSHFPKGWFCVMNPPQDVQADYKNPTSFDPVENKHFGTDKIWSTANGKVKAHLGFDKALKQLLKFYHVEARKTLPQLEGLARSEKQRSEQELESLPQVEDNPQFTINKAITNLTLELNNYQEGYNAMKQNLWKSIMEAMRDLEFIMDSSKPRFTYLNDMTDKDMERVPIHFRQLFSVYSKDDVMCIMEEYQGRDVNFEINPDRMIAVFYLKCWDVRKKFIEDVIKTLKKEVHDVVLEKVVKPSVNVYPAFFARVESQLEMGLEKELNKVNKVLVSLLEDFKQVFKVRVRPSQHYDRLKTALSTGEDNAEFRRNQTYLLVKGEHIEFRQDRQSSWKRARVAQVSSDGCEARLKFSTNKKEHIKWIHIHHDLVRRVALTGGNAGGMTLDQAKRVTPWRVDFDQKAGREWYWNKKSGEKSVTLPPIFEQRPDVYEVLKAEKVPGAPGLSQPGGGNQQQQQQGGQGQVETVDSQKRTFLLDPSNPIEARIGQVTAAVRAYIEERDRGFFHALTNTIVRHFIKNLSLFREECQKEFGYIDEQQAKDILNVDGSVEKQRSKLKDKIQKLSDVEKEIKKLKNMSLD